MKPPKINIIKNGIVYECNTHSNNAFDILFECAKKESEKCINIEYVDCNKYCQHLFLDMIGIAFDYVLTKYNNITQYAISTLEEDELEYFCIISNIIYVPILNKGILCEAYIDENSIYKFSNKIMDKNNIYKIKDVKNKFLEFFKYIKHVIKNKHKPQLKITI